MSEWEEFKAELEGIRTKAQETSQAQEVYAVNNWLCEHVPPGGVTLPQLLSERPSLAQYLAPEEDPVDHRPIEPWFVRFYGLTFRLQGLYSELSYGEFYDLLSKDARGAEQVTVAVPTGHSKKSAWSIGNEWVNASWGPLQGIQDPIKRYGKPISRPPPDDPETHKGRLVTDIRHLVEVLPPFSVAGAKAWTLSQGCPWEFVKSQYPFLSIADMTGLGFHYRNAHGGFYSTESDTWLNSYTDLVNVSVFGSLWQPDRAMTLQQAATRLGIENPPELGQLMNGFWAKALGGDKIPETSWKIARIGADLYAERATGPFIVDLTLRDIADRVAPNVSEREVVNQLSPFIFSGVLYFGSTTATSLAGWQRLVGLSGAVSQKSVDA